jgi:hypothetical protein
MASLAGALDAAIRAVAPEIVGVTIGNRADRSTWAATYPEGVTPSAAAQEAVQAVIDGFVVTPDLAGLPQG